MKSKVEIIFSLLRNALFETGIEEDVKETIVECSDDIYRLSKHHDVAHLVSFAIEKNKIRLPVTDLTKKFKKRHPIAMIRYEAANQMYGQVCEVFENEGVPFIPLKGSVIRKYYPEPWMRTSCDIDILIKEEDLNRAVKLLQERYSFSSDNHRDFHDVSLFSDNGTHLELHFNILENMKDVDTVLSRVWEFAKPSGEESYMYELQPEFLIYHVLAHMSYHVLNGGCGIRSFIDLYLLEKYLKYNEEILIGLCKQGGLSNFKIEVEKLAFTWMENKDCDDRTKLFSEYILSGGVYGNSETASAINHVKNGSKVKYIFTRVFQSYDIMKEKYPVLKKHRWLMPVCQVRRWFYILTSDRKKLAPGLFTAGGNLSKEQVDKKIQLLKNVGLDDK